MSDLKEINISEVCRACLKNTRRMKSLNDNYTSEMCIGEVLMSVTTLSSLEFFNDNDDFPKQICYNCFEDLKRAYNFIVKYRECEEKLLDYLENATNNRVDENTNSCAITVEDILVVENDDLKSVPDNKSRARKSETPKAGKQSDLEVQLSVSNYLCSVCGRSYQTASSLNSHMRIHTGEKPFSCQICGKTFSQHSCVSQHMLTHTAGKSHQCVICNKYFVTKNTLSSHIRTHSGVKPYSCHICHMRFSRNTHVNRHMRVHTGEKPHSCNLCTSAFVEKSHLNTHMRIHTGERPHKCLICYKSFNRNTTLRRHMIRHSDTKPYECELCERSFIQKASLSLHMRRQHPNDSDARINKN